MRIAVLSDTHMERLSPELVQLFEERLEQEDVLLHLGDFTAETVWSFLSVHPRFYEVAGNMDRGAWAEQLPDKRVIQVDGIRIGMIHGCGVSQLHRLATDVFDPGLDLICFGHTHRPLWRSEPGRSALLNPGSFSLPRGGQPGYAVIEVCSGRLAAPQWERVGA